MEGWGVLRLLGYGLWCRVVGLGGVGVWVVGEELGDEIGVHDCWFDGIGDGDVDGGWSGRIC